ncbi:MAG TPA: c-type cytochrome [Gemmataceae bacterium]|nr:c-type cytochrome [Gemmataceae bacterium]
MRTILASASTLLLISSLFLLSPRVHPAPREEPHRSPVDVVLLPGGRLALTANHTADSLSLVDISAGKVLAELSCGRKPVAVACSPDGRHAAVSNLWSGTLSLFDLDGTTIKPAGTLQIGIEPRGLVFTAKGRLYAALAGNDEVIAIDWASRKITQRWPAPREPRHLALSPDSRFLAAASSRSAQVYLWDLTTGKLVWTREIGDAFNLRTLAFTPDGRALICAHGIKRSFPVSRENIDKGWVTDSRLTRLPLDAKAVPSLEQIALDKHGQAVGDPHGVAFDPSGRYLAVTAGGTHEMLVFESSALPWTGGDPGDFLHESLAKNDGKLRRLPLEGRPLALTFLPGGSQAVVANYLRDALQIVNVRAGRVVRTIALGEPKHLSPARQGEALFYDARRSHNQWFSCHTCHVDGHTCGLTFDTLNDDSYGNAKLTPSLHGVARTAPWTWHGWQKSLGAAVEKSYVQTMFGPKPSADEVRAVVTFLGTLDHPPNPHRIADNRLSVAAKRGQALFAGAAKCARCHAGPDYTSEHLYDVKLDADGSPYRRWNPPTLRGLWQRGPYLHDGRAATLDDLLQGPHAPEKLGGQKLSPGQRQDLIAFLQSL